MTDIERRALMGDRQAQEECTRQGILLPCWKCGGEAEVNELHTGGLMELVAVRFKRQSNFGTPAPRRRLGGVGSAVHTRPKGQGSGIATMGQAKPMTAIVIASIRKAVKKMVKQRLIDGDELYGIESLLNTDIIQNSPEASWLMAQVLYDIQASPTIDPETLPIVRQLRAELANCKQELRQIKYCYGIAKNGEKQFRKQNDEITAAWAECAKKLKQVTAERDAAAKNRAKLAEYELTVCEEFCYGDAQHDIPPCEWLIDGKCALREWVKEYA